MRHAWEFYISEFQSAGGECLFCGEDWCVPNNHWLIEDWF